MVGVAAVGTGFSKLIMERAMFKQRIVGALVLVAIGAIVIPFLLDMHRDGQWWGKDNIPPKPDNGFVTRVLPLDAWAQQTHRELAQATTEPKQVRAEPKQVRAEPEQVRAEQAPAPAAALAPAITATPPTATPVAAAVSPPGGWMVQLASFSNAANAEELRQRLQAKGYRVSTEALKQDGQAIYRVRIGPETERAEADALRARVERDFKLKGLVLHVP